VAWRTVWSMARERVRRHHHGGIARVHAGVLDVFEHAADHGGLAVADAIDVELDGVLEEFVDEHGLAGHHVEHWRTTAFSSSRCRG